MNQKHLDDLKRASLYVFFGLLAYMPFHIFLSTWLGTTFHMLGALKAAKDVVLVGGLAVTILLSMRERWFDGVRRDRLLWLVCAYGVLTVALALLRPTDGDAEILAVAYNTRFLLFFMYGGLLVRLHDAEALRRVAVRVVIGAATAALFFGVLQYAVVPNDTLTHVGYSRENGVLPAFFIDDKPDLERVMSTLRDPNSFGSYVVIMLSLGAAFLLKAKDRAARQMAGGLLLLGTLCLWFTFSRSAWLGATGAIGATLVFGVVSERMRRFVLIGGLGIVIIGGISLWGFRDSYLVQNVVLHADESTVLEDPNELRVRFWRESVEAITTVPLGHGPGTAGLTSIRNNVQGAVLNENYYLQIAHEVGVLGLGLFLAIVGVVGLRLYKVRERSVLELALLTSLAGLIITNALVHIWSNEAVAYTWWGLAGLALGIRAKRKVAAES